MAGPIVPYDLFDQLPSDDEKPSRRSSSRVRTRNRRSKTTTTYEEKPEVQEEDNPQGDAQVEVEASVTGSEHMEIDAAAMDAGSDAATQGDEENELHEAEGGLGVQAVEGTAEYEYQDEEYESRVEEYEDQGEGVAEEDEDRDVALPRSQTRRQKYIARRKRERPAFSDEEDDWFLENEDDESEDEEYALETRRARQRNRPHVQMNSAPRRADRSKAARRAEDEEDEAAVSEVRSLLLSLSFFFPSRCLPPFVVSTSTVWAENLHSFTSPGRSVLLVSFDPGRRHPSQCYLSSCPLLLYCA